MKKRWYKLDNVGKYYSFINSKKTPPVFRYSVTLKKNIDLSCLNKALKETINFFPMFNVHLKKGFFWYYLETSNRILNIEEENLPICSKIYESDDDILYRVSYYKNRINFEVSHIISDGRGSLTFFKFLISKYLILKENIDDIQIINKLSTFSISEDSFDKYYKKEKVVVPKIKNVYRYKGKKNKNTKFFEYHINTEDVLKLAHKYKTTLTGLIVSVLINSFKKIMYESDLNKNIKIEVPVDLRNFYKSVTSRNFFGLTIVNYKFNSRKDKLEDIIKKVDADLKNEKTKEIIKQRTNQLISLEKNIFLRIAPLFLKDIVLRIADKISTSSSTSSVSNVGKVDFGDLNKYIKNFNAFSTTTNIKLVVCSFNDDLSIGISSKYVDNEVIREFVNFFCKNGIEGVMNVNGGYDNE